jgi:hypothetical protein
MLVLDPHPLEVLMAQPPPLQPPARPGLHPTVVGAVVTGLLGLVTALIVALVQGSSGGTPATPGVTVQDVSLSSKVGSFNVKCPVTFAYEGRISVSEGRGDVAYRFVYREGIDDAETTGDIQTVSFAGPGSAPVRHEWTPSIPDGEVSRSVTLEVLRPLTRRSNTVTISGRCDASLPDPPNVPPPDVTPPR